MADKTNAAPSPDDPSAAEQPSTHARKPTRLNQALAWVGIAAGGLFIVAAVFFSGFFLSWSEHMGMGHMGMGHGSMDCCDHMKPGEQMTKPGAMTEPGMMGPHASH